MLKNLGIDIHLPTMLWTLLLSPLLIFALRIVLSNLKRFTEYAIEGAMYWMSRYFMRSISGVLTLRRYCKVRLEDPRTKYLRVPATHDVTVPVDELFVPLVLENQIATQEGFTHATLLEAGTRILVLGDPGSGKSSLLKKVFRESCSSALSTWVTPNTHLPVLVELKNLEVPSESQAESKGEWLLDQIEREVCRTEAYRMNECFQAYSRTVDLLILLDGLDEVSSERYGAVRDAINGLSIFLAERSENNVVILTSRTQFHLQVRDDFSTTFPVVLSLRPFSPTDIYRFLSRWTFPKSTNGALNETSRIYKDLTNRSNVRDMCRNPLVLSMYVAADQASGGGQPPESRVEFYSKVTEELVTRRRQRQTGLVGSVVKPRQQREELLGKLAYKHLVHSSESANHLSWPTAVEEVVRLLKCNREEAETYLRELSKETGLFSEERSGESFKFIHLTFCEFLAAQYAIRNSRGEWTSLFRAHRELWNSGSKHGRTRLHEVVPFACGLLQKSHWHSALSDVSAIGDPKLLAKCFLETKLYEHEAWTRLVDESRASLLERSTSTWDREWLADLHSFNIVVRDADLCAMHVPDLRTVNLADFYGDLFNLNYALRGAPEEG